MLPIEFFQIPNAGTTISPALFSFREDWAGGGGSFDYLYGTRIGDLVTIGIQLTSIQVPNVDALAKGHFNLSTLALPESFRPINTIPTDYSRRVCGSNGMEVSGITEPGRGYQPEFTMRLFPPAGGQGVPSTDPFIRIINTWIVFPNGPGFMNSSGEITYDRIASGP